jgi:hypothetical protein
MAILKKSAGKIDMTKVDLSAKGVLILVVAFAVLLGAFGGGKWLLGKGKAVVQGVVPQATGTGDLEGELGL